MYGNNLLLRINTTKQMDTLQKVPRTRRRINNDASKLLFAVGLGDLQRKLLMDFRCRCSAIPGMGIPDLIFL